MEKNEYDELVEDIHARRTKTQDRVKKISHEMFDLVREIRQAVYNLYGAALEPIYRYSSILREHREEVIRYIWALQKIKGDKEIEFNKKTDWD